MNSTKIIFAFALLILFLSTANAKALDTGNGWMYGDENGYMYITSNPSGADVYFTNLGINKEFYYMEKRQ
ncbi:MAG: hypothetical protein HYW05_04195 [Candidatus Diapherotrites archaeon]|nr:hypothetical protein [Candidatus Diapherotrites archaeon]